VDVARVVAVAGRLEEDEDEDEDEECVYA